MADSPGETNPAVVVVVEEEDEEEEDEEVVECTPEAVRALLAEVRQADGDRTAGLLGALFRLVEDDACAAAFVDGEGPGTVLQLMETAGDDDGAAEVMATGCAILMSAAPALPGPAGSRACDFVCDALRRPLLYALEPLARNVCCLAYSLAATAAARGRLAGRAEPLLAACLLQHRASPGVVQYAVAAMGLLLQAAGDSPTAPEVVNALVAAATTDDVDQDLQADCLGLLLHVAQHQPAVCDLLCDCLAPHLLRWVADTETVAAKRRMYAAGLLGALVQGAGAEPAAGGRARCLAGAGAPVALSAVLHGPGLPPRLHRTLLGAFATIGRGTADLPAVLRRPGDPAAAFHLEVRPSGAPDAGLGVFLVGEAAPGTCLTIYPGEMQSPDAWQPGADAVGVASYRVQPGSLLHRGNCYLVQCATGHCVDGSDAAVSRVAEAMGLGQDGLGEAACGQRVNHPPPGVRPNVLLVDVTAADIPGLPCRLRLGEGQYASPPAAMVLLALRPIRDEELWLDYHWDVAHAPPWYAAVPDSVGWPADDA